MTVDKEANTALSINCIPRPLYSSIYLRTIHRIAWLLEMSVRRAVQQASDGRLWKDSRRLLS